MYYNFIEGVNRDKLQSSSFIWGRNHNLNIGNILSSSLLLWLFKFSESEFIIRMHKIKGLKIIDSCSYLFFEHKKIFQQ